MLYPPYDSETRGMLRGDFKNPDFRDWNRIYVPYCSGDVWEGQAEDPLNPWDAADPWRGYFQVPSVY